MNTMPQPVADRYIPQSRSHSNLLDWLTAAYVICLPVQIAIGDFHLAPSDIFLMAILCSVPLGLVKLRYVKQTWSIWHIGLLLSFCTATIVTISRTGQITNYALINKLIGMLVLFAGYAVIVGQINSWQRIRWILRLLIGSIAIQNAAFVAAFMLLRTTGISIPGLDVTEPRLVGFLIDPNAYGGLLVVALSLHMLTHYSREPLIGGWLGKATIITLAMGMMLTYSRSAWIGLGGVFLISIIARPKTAINLILITALAIAAILTALGSDYLNDMTQLSSRGTQQSRIEMAGEAIPMFWESPVLGIGLGVFEYRMGAIIHNTPLWILTECGIVGLAIFAGFVIWFMQRALHAYRLGDKQQKSLILGLVMASVAMMGLSIGIEALYQRHLWLIWALIASSYVVIKQSRSRTRLIAPTNRRQETCA